MKQIKGTFLFLMSIVLVAFGSQDSKSSKNLVKQLEDETKKVGDKIKEVKEVKTAKVEAKGIFPAVAKPAATPIILLSAIPVLKNRLGYSFAKVAVLVEQDKSASNTTISVFWPPNSLKVSPYA